MARSAFWDNQARQSLGLFISNTLRPYAERIPLDGDRYMLVFDTLEILTALNIAYHKGTVQPQAWYLTSLNAFTSHRRESRGRILQEIEESLTTMGDASPFVTCNLFGETKERCLQVVSDLEQGNVWAAVKRTADS